MDHYNTLGVPRTASAEEIKRAFRLLAHKHHPDKGGNEVIFKRITAAYAIIGNEQKRGQYDQAFGASVYQGPNPAGNKQTGFPGPMYDFNGMAGHVQFDFGSFNEAVRAARESMRNQHRASINYGDGPAYTVEFDNHSRTYVIRPRKKPGDANPFRP